MAGRPLVAAAAGVRAATMVEREHELAALTSCLDAVAAGSARVAVIEGVAGIGKTALLDSAREEAELRGIRVLGTRMPHLSAAGAYALLRRLLGPEVARTGGPGALTGAAAFAAPLFTPGGVPAAGVDYGCQWLLAALADAGPLLLTVDDAQWADADSLRVLVDAAEDLQHTALGVMVTARPAADRPAEAMLARLATLGWSTLVRPAPLSRPGVAAMLRSAFGTEPSPAFADACAQASGGNVFYLRELVRPLVTSGAVPDAPAVDRLAAIGPETLVRTVRWRLSELGDVATAVAQAAAVLGDDASLRDVAVLAGVTPEEAGRATGGLEAASILGHGDPVAFPHPLVRGAVEQTIAPGGLGGLHARAARVLQDAGAPGADVAEHLLVSPPGGSAAVARLLVAEARRDLESGSATAAHQLLRRALAEPPPAAARPCVLLALAEAERAIGAPEQARAHLAEVVETGSRELSLGAMAELFEVYYDLDDEAGARRLHERAFAAEPYGASPAEIRLRATLMSHVANGLIDRPPAALTDLDIDALPMDSGEQRRLLLCTAIHLRTQGVCPPDEFLTHLRRVVGDLPADRPLTYWEVLAALEATAFLSSAEAMAEADAVLDRLHPDVARLRRAAPDLQAEWSHRTVLNRLRCGRFEDALIGLAEAEEFAHRYGLAVYASLAHYARGCIALERGDYAEAGRHLRQGPAGAGFVTALGDVLSGRPAQALERLAPPDDADAPVTEAEIEFEVHLVASHAYELMGDRAGALREADRELALRRRHGPSFRLALALRRRASFAPAREAAELLAQAMRACAGTPRLPVRARVQGSYGAALRRTGRLRDARIELAAALDLAEQLGMVRLSGRLRDEVRVAGGRPRRTRVTGAAALTGSQVAVARLAADGRTNREIAESLYVTMKTVETHLAAVYRKLAVPGREYLGAALAGKA